MILTHCSGGLTILRRYPLTHGLPSRPGQRGAREFGQYLGDRDQEQQGKLDIPDNWSAILAEEAFRQLPITWAHAYKVGELPEIHQDPFDRLLIAQSLIEDLMLVTHDDIVQRYGGKVLKT